MYKQFIASLDHNTDIDLFWRLPLDQVKDPEILMDIVEELHGSINSDGLPVDTFISGTVAVLINLPKMPEISFQLKPSINYSDISYHQSALESQQKSDSIRIRFFAQNGPINIASYLVDSIVVGLPFKLQLEFKDGEISPFMKATINTEMIRGKYYRLIDFEVNIIFPQYYYYN